MFKSLFSKYLVAFIAIILICFTMLILVSYSIVINYAADAKIESARSVVSTVEQYLSSDDLSGEVDSESLSGMLHLAATGNDRLAIVLTDADGRALAIGSNYECGLNKDMRLSEALITQLYEQGEVVHAAHERSVFGDNLPVVSIALHDGQDNMYGTLTVCSPTTHWMGLLTTMARTIVMASLWIMLAALIAVYFISERVSAPLREMRRAAKDFAGGNFERRVVVHGDDEIAELGIAFNQMAQSLENLDKMRSSFMANVSHDLRTPMTTIAGFIDAIRDGVIPPEKQDHYLGIVSAEVHRLSRLVSSLLDVTRIQAGDRKFVMKPFDICEMGRQILISFEQQVEAKGLQIEFVCDEENMIVLADHDAIYQIFYNICDNAVKFSFDGGIFRVSIQRKTDEKNKIQVSVYNQGEGIAAEDIPFVFERFYKGDKSRGLDRKGVGLGLYISKTIIAAHGEKIWANSVQGKDCRFSFTLTEHAQPRD